jgi:hypothetical protein
MRISKAELEYYTDSVDCEYCETKPASTVVMLWTWPRDTKMSGPVALCDKPDCFERVERWAKNVGDIFIVYVEPLSEFIASATVEG